MAQLVVPAISPLSILAVFVNVAATGWVSYSTLGPGRRRDHLLLGIAGVLCSYQIVRLASEFGWWGATSAAQLDRVADLSATLMGVLLLALCVATGRRESAAGSPEHVRAESGGQASADILWPDDPSHDRRRQLRVQIQKPVLVETLDDHRRELRGHTVDFSGSGLGVVLCLPIAVRTIVLVHLNEGLLLGEVANCTEVRGEYRLGLRVTQFLARTQASPEAERTESGRKAEELPRSSWIIS